MDEMILEAQEWMPEPVPTAVLRKLLGGLRLVHMESETLDDDYSAKITVEKLALTFYMPEQSSWNDKVDDFRGCKHKWECYWHDCYGQAGVAGRVTCPPFVEDPPMSNALSRIGWSDPDKQAKVDKHVNDMNARARVIRPQWDLKFVHGLKEKCENWRRAAGIKVKDLAWEDAARAVCAGVGMLARDEEANKGQFVLQRLMLCLEKEMRALKNPAFDKTALSESEKLRKFGGVLTSPSMIACLRHEERWKRNTKYPRKAMDVAAAAPSVSSDGGGGPSSNDATDVLR